MQTIRLRLIDFITQPWLFWGNVIISLQPWHWHWLYLYWQVFLAHGLWLLKKSHVNTRPSAQKRSPIQFIWHQTSVAPLKREADVRMSVNHDWKPWRTRERSSWSKRICRSPTEENGAHDKSRMNVVLHKKTIDFGFLRGPLVRIVVTSKPSGTFN